MRKITISILLQLLFVSFANSQVISGNVCTGDMILTSQAEVDAFDCVKVTGTLEISGSDITNLDALSELTSVGSLAINNNNALTNVDGLSSLQEIPDDLFPHSLQITGNNALENLDGFSSVASIAGAIDISNNASLETINGFSLLTSIRTLIISNNPALISINGFKNVTLISTYDGMVRFNSTLLIINNASLADLDGLSSLRNVDGYYLTFVIRDNASLSNIDGLSSLTTIEGVYAFFSISNNPSLRNVDGLSSLSFFDGGASSQITISNNVKLENIDGLSALEFHGEGSPSIHVTSNPSLTRCCGLYPYLSAIPDPLPWSDISENGAGCTVEDIIAGGPCKESISSFSLINERTGDVVLDFYESITLDIGDPDFSKWTIQANALPNTVGSVVFRLDKKIKQIENVFPYTLQKNVLSFLKPGMHTLTTEVFSKSHKRGEQGIGRTATINVINSAAILNFQVVDTSGKVLMDLNDGDAINIKDPAFKRISIIANTTTHNVGSVKFWLNGRKYNIENQAPYSLNGDYGGYFNPWKARAGNYTLVAVPYSRNWGQGYAGQAKKIQFKVIEQQIRNEKETKVNIASGRSTEYHGEEILFSMFPVPVEDDLHIKIDIQAGNSFYVTIRNIQGQSVHTGTYSIYQLENTGIPTGGWQSGIYFMQILGNNGFGKIVKFVKK